MTASGAYDAGRTLGDFDVRALKMFRDLAERHVSEALKKAGEVNVLVAAADPSQFIPAEAEADFYALAISAWRDALDLVQELAGEVFEVPLFQSIISHAVAESSSVYLDLLNTIIGNKAFKTLREPIYGEFMKGNFVQYGDVRPMLVHLGGGSVDPDAPMAGGITSGQTMKDWLGQNGIASDKKIWLYGYDDEPRRTFNGHLQMDGLVFEDWDDPALKIAPQDYWLRRTHYQVGDHWGCACVIAPYIPNFGAPYQIDTP